MLPTGCKSCTTAWTNAVVASWVVLVAVAAVGAKGVPVKVGLADKTTLVVPVDAVTPVPPLATGSVPVTPVVIGKPVQLVRTPADGVPMFGVTSTGLVRSALVATAIAILAYSVLISVPLTIFNGLPDVSASLVAKLVLCV